MTEKLLPCPFCGGEARTFDLNGTAQATCAGDAYACAGPDVVAPVAMWNRRTPAPEGEAWRTVPVNPPLEMIDAFLRHIPTDYAPDRHQKRAGYAAMLAASPVVPAPEGVFVSETCEGEVCWCGKPAVRKVGEEFADDEPNPNRHNLTRYICAHHFAELMGPAGARSVGIAPVVPVGVSREEIGRIIDGIQLTIGDHGPRIRHGERLRATDAIIAALRPTDTGRE